MKRPHYLYIIALLTALFTLGSCIDDESFTTDSSVKLSFSVDTLSFDTVFTTISSPTERFCAYNTNKSSGLRIAKVELESGGKSGFKMNVDGQYGTEVSSVEVLKKDSVFIFVEVNLPEVDSNKPVKIEDRIIFTLASGVKQSVALRAWGQNVKQLKAPVITSTTRFDNSIPYVIYDSLVIKEGATLVIPAGTTICMHNYASIFVHGGLRAEGTVEEPVVFRGDRPDKMFPYLPYDRLTNQWGGINVLPTCTEFNLNNADIHSGNYGVFCDDGMKGTLTISNSSIHNIGGEGLGLYSTKALITNSCISNCLLDCVSLAGSNVNFYHCTIAQFYPWDADRGNAVFATNVRDDNDCILESANFYNCLITGYANDEVMGELGNVDYLNIHFFNSLVNTDISDETYFTDCIADPKDSEICHEKHFKKIDTDNYFYDFHLDEKSTAIGKASSAYSNLYPFDKDGKKRGTTPSYGCYEY